MLVLTRKLDEGIYIGKDVKITVIEITGNQVKLGISAPKDVSIFREEVLDKIIEENIGSIASEKPDARKLPAFLRKVKNTGEK